MSPQLAILAVPALAAAVTVLAWSWLLLLRSPSADASPRGRSQRRTATPSRRSLVPLGIGLAIAGFLWMGMNQPFLAAGAMVLWMGAVRLLRTRRDRVSDGTELQCAVEAIGTAGRALRSGIPMTGVLRILADESRGQTRTYFQEIVAREALGEDLASSIRSVLLSSPIPALRAFGLSLIQQISAGGNLAEVTDRLAKSLVERERIRRRIKTILAYGRAAAIVLSLTPLIAVPVLCRLVDGYAALLFNSGTGQILLVTAALMLVVGGVMIQRMTGVDRTLSPRGVA
jgi:tight adherence protein B